MSSKTMEEAYSFFQSLSGLPISKLEEEVRNEFPDMPKGLGKTLKKVDAFKKKYSDNLTKIKKKIQKTVDPKSFYVKCEKQFKCRWCICRIGIPPFYSTHLPFQ